MSAPEQIPYVGYVANGIATEFPITFDLHDVGYLVVTLNKEIPESSTYTVDLNGLKVVFAQAPKNGDQVELYRDTVIDRDTDYKTYDNSFRPEAVNYDFDKIIHILQEQHMIDAELASRLKQEIEWRRTHDANFDELAKMRDAQVFAGLKGYIDTLYSASNPNIFDGVTAGIVFALDKKSVQTHLEIIYEQLSDISAGADVKIKEESDRAKAAELTLAEDIHQEELRAIAAESELLTKVNALGGGASYGYTSYAEMVASASSIPAHSIVTVGGDPDPSKDGAYIYNGSTFNKSPYDPLQQSMNYVNANPKFKQQKIVAGDNFNNFTKPGTYYHWGPNLTEAQVPNGPFYVDGNLAYGVLEVKNTLDTPTSASTQIFYSMYDGYSPLFRKRKQDGTWPTVWDSYTLDSKRFNTVVIASGQDILTLGQGRYNIPSITIGNSLINMPSAPYKFGVIDVDVFAGYRIIRFTPYGRDTSFYTNSSYESNAWSGWQQYTPNTSGQLNALLKAITKTDYFGKKFTASELAGTTVYAAAYYAGFNSNSGNDGTSFNAVNARIYNIQGGEIQYRVYAGGSVSSGSFGYSVSAANQANYLISGVCKKFPISDTGSAQIIELDKVVSIPPNTPFVIVFRRTDLRTFGLGQHTEVSGNLENRGFNLIASAVDWGVSNLSNGSTPAFTQAGFQLFLNIDTSGGPDPEPEIYTPELILPQKIYSLEGLQGHIYLEHLLVESYKQYEFDITCTKGAQRNRGFVWQPTSADAAGDYPITISVHDKQKGLLLNAITATLKLPSKTAKSGNVNVCFIADSLGVAGTITQRLLDISVTDVTKVQLIGTRGSGPNKHEGRGGWTINDYTTAGRTYYQFTVSGVTEVPAINATTYSYGGSVFMVQEAFISGGSGSINCNLVSGSAPTTGASGTLTKTNASAGDASIAFSNVQPTAGNPFWDGSALNFANYLSVNSLSTPDIVLIQLGINDTFSFTTDGAVDSFTATAFPKLDLLISSIKSANPSVKVGVCSPPSYADQDAFGTNYGCGQTSWRAKRNIVRFNRNLFAYFKDKEASNIFVVGSGVNVDTENNFPTGTGQINSHNTNTITTQTNAVHPADSGYKQIGDAIFSFIKSI